MVLVPQVLEGLQIAPVERCYTWRDCALYALGLGYGDDPGDPAQLRYVTEVDQQVMPAMVNVLCHDSSWMKRSETGIDYSRVVHGAQAMEILSPLPPEGEFISQNVIEDIVDKGPGKGAMITSHRTLRDAKTGKLYATIRMTIFCRGAGGFGGRPEQAQPPHPEPDSAPALSVTVSTRPDQALIYRLSGDFNPLHSDPATAQKAGFDRPILHGLATYGIACRALINQFCGSDGSRVRAMEGRFSAPVYPGETLSVDMWPQGPGRAAFRVRVDAREVLRNGRFDFFDHSTNQ